MTRLVRLTSFACVVVLAAGVGCTRKPKGGVTPIPGYQPEIRQVTVPADSGSTTDPLRDARNNTPTNPGAGFRDPNANRQIPTDNGSSNVRPLPRETTPIPVIDPNPPVGGGEQPERDMIDGMVLDREAFKGNTLYFEFDRSRIRSEERPKLAAVAEMLKSAPDNKLMIEGHCDERGTEEYNRALGERRALACREYLASLGIKGDRVRTVSYGEDRPAVEGHDESAWSKNRRSEFILLKPPGTR